MTQEHQHTQNHYDFQQLSNLTKLYYIQSIFKISA